jgi:nucleoid DNA-binding protein
MKDVTATVEKDLTATELFKLRLQNDFTTVLGQKISKDTAWQLFKAAVNSPVDHVLETKQPLSLAGVGVFHISETQPRVGTVTRVDPRTGVKREVEQGVKRLEQMEKAGIDFVPRMRWTPSSKIDEKVEVSFGMRDPVEHKKRTAPTRTPATSVDAIEDFDVGEATPAVPEKASSTKKESKKANKDVTPRPSGQVEELDLDLTDIL